MIFRAGSVTVLAVICAGVVDLVTTIDSLFYRTQLTKLIYRLRPFFEPIG